MITRGHYIGEIIDEFAAIGEQVRMRGKLGAFDLNVYAENFFRDVLNDIHGSNLTNLNQDRSNEPGLDLGDTLKRLAFQVTSTATSEKVNHTLAAITEEQSKQYKKIIVLVIGKRQSSYTINKDLAEKFKFEVKKNIWDLDSLARKAMNLEIDALQQLHRTVRKNVAKLRIELEVADDEGNYPTSSYSKWEERLSPKFGSTNQFLAFYESEMHELDEGDREKLNRSIRKLGSRLSKLPRVTREFLAALLERREEGESRRQPHSSRPWALEPKARREYRAEDFKDELAILEAASLLSVDYDDPHEYGPPEIFITLSRNEDLADWFVRFVEKNGLSYRKIIGAMDFSAF